MRPFLLCAVPAGITASQLPANSSSSASLPSHQRSASSVSISSVISNSRYVLYREDGWDGYQLAVDDAAGWLDATEWQRMSECLECVLGVSTAATASLPPDLRCAMCSESNSLE